MTIDAGRVWVTIDAASLNLLETRPQKQRRHDIPIGPAGYEPVGVDAAGLWEKKKTRSDTQLHYTIHNYTTLHYTS